MPADPFTTAIRVSIPRAVVLTDFTLLDDKLAPCSGLHPLSRHSAKAVWVRTRFGPPPTQNGTTLPYRHPHHQYDDTPQD